MWRKEKIKFWKSIGLRLHITNRFWRKCSALWRKILIMDTITLFTDILLSKNKQKIKKKIPTDPSNPRINNKSIKEWSNYSSKTNN